MFGACLFDMQDILTTRILIPLGGMTMTIFVGWILDKKVFREGVGVSPRLYGMSRFALRYLFPVAIAIVFLQLIGIINAVATHTAETENPRLR